MCLLLFCIVTFSKAVAKPIPEELISKESVAMNILPEEATTFTGLIGSDDPDIALLETAVSGINIDQVQEMATSQSLPYLHDVEPHDQDVGQLRQPDSSSNSVLGAVTFSPDANLTPTIGTKLCKSKEVSLCCKSEKFEYQNDRYAFPLNAERAALIIATWNNSPHLKGFPDSAVGYGNCPDCMFLLRTTFSIFDYEKENEHNHLKTPLIYEYSLRTSRLRKYEW